MFILINFNQIYTLPFHKDNDPLKFVLTFFLDSPSIRRAFHEWRTHCIENRLLWGNLKDRLNGVFRKLTELDKGGKWMLPLFPSDPKIGPLRRPNRNN